MSLTMSSFNRKNACVNNAGGVMRLQSRANRFLDEAIIMKGIIVDYLKGDLQFGSVKELEQIIADSYVEIDDVDVSQEAYEHNLAKQIFRYCKSERRHKSCKIAFPDAAISIDLSGFVETQFDGVEEINVKFDFIIDDGANLEGVILKTGTPKLGVSDRAKRNVYNEIPLYLGLRALRSLIPEGETRRVISSYYYMKKPKDTSASAYNDDYFSSAPTRSLIEDYTNIPQAPETELDTLFKAQLDKYAVGYEKDELDEESDCKHCPKYAVCFYKPIPEKSKELEVKAREKHKLNDEQQAIVDARNGIFIVNAGAGSGKTETAIKQRTVSIIEEELADMITRYENGEDIDSEIAAEEKTSSLADFLAS